MWLRRVQALIVLVLLLPLAAGAQTPISDAPWFVEGNVACPRIALIFDIGIGETPSETVLDTLIEKDVSATMFPMGSFARSQPDYLRRLADAGFEIGTHGDTNLWLTDAPDDAIRADIGASVDVDRGGHRPTDRSVPHALCREHRRAGAHVVASEGLLPVGWKVAAPDWSADATEEGVYNAVFYNAYPGAIVEMHLDGPATERSTARALPRLIDDLRARGFEFVTIGEMLQPCAVHRDADYPADGHDVRARRPRAALHDCAVARLDADPHPAQRRRGDPRPGLRRLVARDVRRGKMAGSPAPDCRLGTR